MGGGGGADIGGCRGARGAQPPWPHSAGDTAQGIYLIPLYSVNRTIYIPSDSAAVVIIGAVVAVVPPNLLMPGEMRRVMQ